ncbi:MAG: DUF362 domain-containing protein [Candidatus Freyarchaeota archaeon]
MAKSEVFYMDDRSESTTTSLVAKALHLFDVAGLSECIDKGDYVAVKLHMGEWNNTAYLRPVYVRAIVDKIKELGGRPFVVDTTTLPYAPFCYRTNAWDHYMTIERNGFNSGTVGCPVIIGDGFLGTDDVRVDLPEGYLLKEQYVATAIACADAMIVLTHFKGHPMGVFGGSIKNIGVGCASKRGKYNLHLSLHPTLGLQVLSYFPQYCAGRECPKWEVCEAICPEGALVVPEEGPIQFKRELCKGCLSHLFQTLDCGVFASLEMLDFLEASSVAIADSALASMKTFEPGKVGFINFAIDSTPWCDCIPYSDRPIIPNLGVFASKDIVAIDRACLDMAVQSTGMPGSAAEQKFVMSPGIPKFSAAGSFMGISEDIQCNVGQEIGLGSKEYELKTVEPMESAVSTFLHPDPAGSVLKRFYKRIHPVPKEGFKRVEQPDLQKVR